MNEENLYKFRHSLLEISSLVHILRYAMKNPEQVGEELRHYEKLTALIEEKINKVYDEI